MNELSKRISEALDSTGKRDAHLSKETGISRSAFAQWRNGSIKSLKADSAIALEKATGYSAEWLATGRGNKRIFEINSELGPDLNNNRKYPLISFVRAGNRSQVTIPFHPEDADSWLTCVKDLGEHGYVLRVKEDSMTSSFSYPSFPNGILIFINPNASIAPGDFVIAKREIEDEATFKQYKMVDGEPYLHAINPNWPNQWIKLLPGDKLCGKVEFAGFFL